MNKSTGHFLLILCAFLLTSCYRNATVPPNSKTCNLNLRVFISQGSNTNRTISGQVAFGSSAWSSFKGNFVEESGASHPISFYFDGQAVHFILDIEQGRIFGTGIMESDLATCSGNGGGTLSGPLSGDLGDWRGEWISTGDSVPPVQPGADNFSSLFCIYLPTAAVILFLAIPLFRLLAPSKKNRASNSVLQKIDQGTRPERKEDSKPFAEYLATYTADDKLFDLSFEIEKSSQYLGECGITVAKALAAKSSQATALEIWLFDARDIRTVSKILASNFCFNQENLRNELGQKGQVILIQPGETVTVEVGGLKAKAKVLQVEYEPASPNPQSIFKKVVIEIGVWSNTG